MTSNAHNKLMTPMLRLLSSLKNKDKISIIRQYETVLYDRPNTSMGKDSNQYGAHA